MMEEDSRASTLKTLERSGGGILTGGKPLDRDGFYLEPTLVEVEHRRIPSPRKRSSPRSLRS
jgi:hypothetical protein